MADAITAAPDTATPLQAAPYTATPLQAVAAGLDALSALFTADRREPGARIQALIAGNGELRERAVAKRTGLAAAMTDALHRRGVPEPGAGLAAELGVRAFHRAFDQWADPAARQSLTDLTRQALDELRAAVAALD